jgi:hypothetical protein
MVYAPIAAILVEMFPTRIRYTATSLPYHIGNGWFGGFLSTTAFALVAAYGNIYSGLWYPVAIAAMSFIVGAIFLPETKTCRSTGSGPQSASGGIHESVRPLRRRQAGKSARSPQVFEPMTGEVREHLPAALAICIAVERGDLSRQATFNEV